MPLPRDYTIPVVRSDSTISGVRPMWHKHDFDINEEAIAFSAWLQANISTCLLHQTVKLINSDVLAHSVVKDEEGEYRTSYTEYQKNARKLFKEDGSA